MSLKTDNETRTGGNDNPKDLQANRSRGKQTNHRSRESSPRESEGRRNRRPVTENRRRVVSSKPSRSSRRKVVRTEDGSPSTNDDKNESLLARTASILRTSSKDLSKAASSVRTESGRMLESIRDSGLVRTLSRGASSRKLDANDGSDAQKRRGPKPPKRTSSHVLKALRRTMSGVGDSNVLREGECSEEITFEKEGDVAAFDDPVMNNSQPERESKEVSLARTRDDGSPRARRRLKGRSSRSQSASRRVRKRREQSVDKCSMSARSPSDKNNARKQVPMTEASFSTSSRGSRLSLIERREIPRRKSMSSMDSTSFLDNLVEDSPKMEENDEKKHSDSGKLMERDSSARSQTEKKDVRKRRHSGKHMERDSSARSQTEKKCRDIGDSSDVVDKKRKPRSGKVKDGLSNTGKSRSTRRMSLRQRESMYENDRSDRSAKAGSKDMDKSDASASLPRSKGRVSMRSSASTLRKSLSMRGASMVVSGQAQLDSVVSSLRQNLTRSMSSRNRLSVFEKEESKAVVPTKNSEEVREYVSNPPNSRERTVPVEKTRSRAFLMDTPRKNGKVVDMASIRIPAKDIGDRINRIQLSYDDDNESSEKNPGQVKPEPSSPSPEDDDNDDKVEVSPGEFAVIRSQEEAWDAVMDGNYVISRCLSCSLKVVSCNNAKFIRCPNCYSISPCFMSLTQNGAESMQPFGVISGLRMEECGDLLLPKDTRAVPDGPSTPTINAVLKKSKKKA